MPMRSLLVALSLVATLMTLAMRSSAAPMARILRIDPRASLTDGAPVLTVVVDLVQAKRVSEAVAHCAALRGSAQHRCQAEALDKPKALFTPFPFPEKNAQFLTTVDGAAHPTTFVQQMRWGDSQRIKGVGTAWLILVDADGSMGSRFQEAKSIAAAFVNAMGPNDIVNVMSFNDAQVVQDSKWLSAAKKGEAAGFASGLAMYPTSGRTRPLNQIIRTAVADGFNDLGNVGTAVEIPMHQALVVLSNGRSGGDPSTTGPGALALQQHLTKGRFPEDNSALPKTPLPVISVWFPSQQLEELTQAAQEFMQGLPNPEIGGFYSIVQAGAAGRGGGIVAAVRDRFAHMHIVKYRVSCIAPNVQQSFQLVFTNVKPMIGGDATFQNVPIGIDPTTWPLDVNVEYTVARAKKDRVHPGGTFRVYGSFCWAGDVSRAEVYFLPKNQPAPPTIEGGDIETAKRAQQQLIAMNMRGKTIEASDTFVEFEAPESDKILLGQGDKAAVRLVVYDNKAKRTSAVDATNILTLPAGAAPFPWLWVVGGIFGFLVLLLLVLAVVRGGGKSRRGGAPPPAPVVAHPYGAAPQGQAYPGAGAAQGYAAPVAGQGYPQGQGYAAPPVAQPYAAGYAAPVQPAAPPAQPAGGDFMYGGQAPQYGLTGAQPQHAAPPPDPYAAGAAMAPGGGSRVVLSGSAGTFQAAAGADLVVGRDSARCQVVLQEPRVSAVHATVRYDSGQVYVRDEGSNNGTFLNGNRLAPGAVTPVPPGSILRFGPVEFVVRVE